MPISARIAGYTFILAILLLAMEVGSYIAVEFLVAKRAPYLLYEEPQFNEDALRAYLLVRDPLLGWPTATALKSESYDSSGSRPNPSFPHPGKECVTLYGDSFTYGDEVTDGEAWGNLLSEKLGCRVGNFGVPGYGTDQALLRFKKNTEDSAPISILGIFPHNVLRNVNQYRYLLAPNRGTYLRFKPRFVLEEEELRLEPLPEPSFSELKYFPAQMRQLLRYEAFLPGNGTGPIPQKGVPYSSVVMNLFFNDRVQNWILKKPSWEAFTHPGHGSGASEVTVAIVREFMDECKKRGKSCVVLTFPTPSSYTLFKREGVASMGSILKELTELKIPYIKLESDLSKELEERGICEILSQPGRCTGHFNPEGNKMVAGVVAKHITENSLLKRKP